MARPTDLRLNVSNQRESNMPPVPATSFRPYGGDCVDAQGLDFYYGKIENTLVEELLRPHMESRGSFLLRDSNTEPGVITISVVDNPRHIYHFKINCKGPNGVYEVTDKLRFGSLEDLIKFFHFNDVPSRNIGDLKLVNPIRFRSTPRSPQRSPPRSPPRSPATELVRSPSRPPRPRRNISPPAMPATRDQDRFLDSRAPVPIPTPGTEPIYIYHDHVYCRAEDLQKSRIDEIMELCKLSDQKYKKCTCGLYMEQSILVEDWMMHIDRPAGDQAESGRVFFVNSVSNLTQWELPERVMYQLGQQYPEKYRFVQKLLQEGSNL